MAPGCQGSPTCGGLGRIFPLTHFPSPDVGRVMGQCPTRYCCLLLTTNIHFPESCHFPPLISSIPSSCKSSMGTVPLSFLSAPLFRRVIQTVHGFVFFQTSWWLPQSLFSKPSGQGELERCAGSFCTGAGDMGREYAGRPFLPPTLGWESPSRAWPVLNPPYF